jgi:urea carboxylase-associated protein 2
MGQSRDASWYVGIGMEWSEELREGAHWSAVLPRGASLRLTDLVGGANVACLLYNAAQPLERYCMPDTLKAQHTAHLTVGHVLYSDMGRILASIVADTVGWHDPLGAVSDSRQVTAAFGATSYATHRNARHLNGRDSLLGELGKFGLGLRDLGPTVNFFSRVVADDSGALGFVPGNSPAGGSVQLRFEMRTLVVLATVQHPMDPRDVYEPRPVRLDVGRLPAPAADDPCRVSCPENARGFVNTERACA